MSLPPLGATVAFPHRKLIRRKPLKHGSFFARWRRIGSMTTCIAVICGGAKAIVLAADKMLTFGHARAPIANKILTLHKNWRVLYAGNDTAPVFPIVDRAVAILKQSTNPDNPTLLEVAAAMTVAWREERDIRTEAKYLKGRVGWTLKRFFDEGKDHFLPADVARLTDAIESEEFDLELLIVGFDDNKRPAILAMEGEGRSVPEQRPNYWAIGSGAPNALTFLTWRQTSASTPTRAALAHAIEAKSYGELAPEVSDETDLVILLSNGTAIAINEKDIEEVLFGKIAFPNKPSNIDMNQLELLNDLPDLKGIPYVWAEKPSGGTLIEMPFDEANRPKSQPPSGIRGPVGAGKGDSSGASGAVIIPTRISSGEKKKRK
jgi:ATP-dependent protease HslVU (ClpYQ) peptidase subunit